MPRSLRGQHIQVSVTVRPETLDEIDELATAESLSRADIIRRLLRRGLEMERLLRQPEPARKAS